MKRFRVLLHLGALVEITDQYCSLPNFTWAHYLQKTLLWGRVFPSLVSTQRLICLESCCEILFRYFSKTRLLMGFGKERIKNKRLFAIWTSSLHANEVSAEILEVFSESCFLLRRFQWCVPACLRKSMGQNAGGKNNPPNHKYLIKII